ncbi:unnamed protein product [Diamesa hyperborea]
MNRLPFKLNQLKRECKRLNDEISAQQMEINNIDNEDTQILNDIKSKELESAKLLQEVMEKQNIKEELMQKSKAVRDKLKTLDEELQEDIESIKEEHKMYMKNLGLRMHLQELKTNVWQIMINYVEVYESRIVLHYEDIHDSFTLISIYPEPTKITEIGEFLKSTNDILGFLFHCRKFMLHQNMQ